MSGEVSREELWKKWEQDQKDDKLKAEDAIWDVSPGFDSDTGAGFAVKPFILF